jgi:mono/diheme cytochrome c family protein
MNTKKMIAVVFISISSLLMACGGGDNEGKEKNASSSDEPKSMVSDAGTYDPKRGEGKFDETNVKIGPLDEAMAKQGEAIVGTKCNSCHKLTDEKLVGPGWKGVTIRYTPHWIMNFITNPDPMIDKDPKVQAQLELCLVRMPNQSLTDEDARQIVEFMRKNDGAK